MSLWVKRGTILAEAKPAELRTASVGKNFSVHWTIGGPKRTHWIELECPGYRTFRSSEFEAPTRTTDIRFGRIALMKR